MLSSLGIHFPRTGFDCVLHQFPKLWHYGLHEVRLDVHGVQVLLELLIGQLVAVFKLAILSASLLNSVVGEMDQP